MAAGLQTSIWDNNIRSVLMLIAYPFIMAAIAWGCAYVIAMAAHGHYAQADDGIRAANMLLLEYWPSILGVVAVWFVVSYFWNTSMIRALSHAHAVTRTEEPELYNLLENLCISVGMKMPQINIIETPARNAFASGIDERSYTITVSRGLLDSLQKDELEAVLGHELTHILNRDVRLMMVTVIFTGMVGFAAQMVWSSFRHGYMYRGGGSRNRGNAVIIVLLVGIILWIGYMATLFMRFAISRRREFMADAGAVKLTKNPEAMMRALLRIQGMDNMPNTPADIDMMCIENAQPFLGLFATHPPIAARVKTLSEMTNTPIPTLVSEAPHLHPTLQEPQSRRNPWGIRKNPWSR